MTKINLEVLKLCTACSIIALTAAPAVAQNADTTDADEVASASEAAPTESRRLAPVTVTSRKREESLQDVPMSITAVDAGLMQDSGYIDLSQVQRVSTNVVIANIGTYIPRIYIRGIGTRNFDLGSEQSVGVFVDGVYQARPSNLDLGLLDLERVEVLKGPQGTLYGRNTIAGALSVVTQAPSEVFEGHISAELGSSVISGDDFYNLSGRISGPLTESGVRGTLAVAYRNREGYLPVQNSSIRGGANEDTVAARAKLLIPLSNAADLTLIGDYMTQEGPAYVLKSVPVLDGSGNVVPLDKDDLYKPEANRDDIGLDRDTWGLSATLDWDLGAFDLTSITAYRELSFYDRFDNDATAVDATERDTTEDSSQFSQEIRLNRSTDAYNLLLGAYYGHDEGDRLFSLNWTLPVPTWQLDAKTSLDSKNYAVFGQLEYFVTDALSLTVGARYGEDEKEFVYNTVSSMPAFANFTQPLNKKWDSFDPMVSLAYDFNENNMAYVSYASGYKSGAFQWLARNAIAASEVAAPEDVDSYEIGYKGFLADGRLELNASAFHMKYKDLQLLLYRNISPPSLPEQFIPLTVNAADSTIDGLEIETKTILTDQWSLDFSYAYLDGTYDEFVRELPTGEIQDFSGNPLVRAPKNTVNVALNYFEDYSFGTVGARVGYFWRDEWNHEEDANAINPRSTVPATGLLDASVSLGFDNGWELSVWGRNLTDERYQQGLINTTGSPQQIFPNEPRTYGVRVKKSFGGN
ncbi:TonB-dependent receptor [Hyphomonas adhaerens MHS-3]|uniref:TonB-dependent receptor n=1 Tax=Hyphomonas adhaerens MHS-3 TaxID=1280949 RepID=A0A069E710_9PROT|nr:TonB-dependent receptor [Hyphomonas adhaerens]KCZ86075.1 TonB-dependent receptor [Hyphomonas adhaerens MHS-3]